MSVSPAAADLGDDWCRRIAGLPTDVRIDLARRADTAPLFAHAYTFHINFRFGGMKPFEPAEFAHRQGLAGLNIHVVDGEGASLNAMSDDELSIFGRQVRELGLEVHVETSTTSRDGLSAAVAGAGDRSHLAALLSALRGAYLPDRVVDHRQPAPAAAI